MGTDQVMERHTDSDRRTRHTLIVTGTQGTERGSDAAVRDESQQRSDSKDYSMDLTDSCALLLLLPDCMVRDAGMGSSRARWRIGSSGEAW